MPKLLSGLITLTLAPSLFATNFICTNPDATREYRTWLDAANKGRIDIYEQGTLISAIDNLEVKRESQGSAPSSTLYRFGAEGDFFIEITEVEDGSITAKYLETEGLTCKRNPDTARDI